MPTPKLVLLNGPPGIGKSTLARRYVADRALTLLLDIDAIRASLGQWEQHNESKLLARQLAHQLASAHLATGHDVVLPQLLERADAIERFREIAVTAGGQFVEVMLLADIDVVVTRFQQRRAELEKSGLRHPEGAIEIGREREAISETFACFDELRATKPASFTVHAEGDIDETYRCLLQVLGT